MNLQEITTLREHSGLPLLFIDSGGTTEYCKNYGLIFNESNLQEKIIEMMSDYEKYLANLEDYPFNSEKMCSDYENLFIDMFNKEELIF